MVYKGIRADSNRVGMFDHVRELLAGFKSPRGRLCYIFHIKYIFLYCRDGDIV